MTQQAIFDDPCLKPLVDHPPDHTIRDSSVEESAQVAVGHGVEVLLYVDVQDPVQSLAPDGTAQGVQRLMGRASRPEAIGAGQEVLLVNRFQHHRYSALRNLVFEGWDAERPLRSVCLGDVCPANRRRLVAARLDAIEEGPKIGLQLHLVGCRRNAVDARSTILTGQSVGLSHPVHVNDMVQRVQRGPALSPRQIGYPLSFRGQVRGVQCPLPCFPSTALSPWRLPSLRRVPASPVPRLRRYYEGATTSPAGVSRSLMGSVPGSSGSPVFVLAEALPARQGSASRPGPWSAGLPHPALCLRT